MGGGAAAWAVDPDAAVGGVRAGDHGGARCEKAQMYTRWRYFQYIPDLRTIRIWFTRLRRDKRDHAVLLAVADELAKEGITLIDSTVYCAESAFDGGRDDQDPANGRAVGGYSFRI